MHGSNPAGGFILTMYNINSTQSNLSKNKIEMFLFINNFAVYTERFLETAFFETLITQLFDFILSYITIL